ncbi:hypothetical protein F5Y09DRAFT_293729 [Xylaria sp. FL1042]|nr:hypothetical protein F5Y09DRAFT_293729 [Xylaria sp. FL1042]
MSMRALGHTGRQLLKLCQSRSMVKRAFTPVIAAPRCGYSSSASDASPPDAASVDIDAIRDEMLARRPHLHYDMMHPTPSLLLHNALRGFLPDECIDKQAVFKEDVYQDWFREHPKMARHLNAGAHFVYFPLQLPSPQLCPDGTDPFHSLHDTPFTRRMWAGGSIENVGRLCMDRRPAVCVERIVDVKARGPAGAEKIFVEVLREYVSERNFKTRWDSESETLKPPTDPTARPTSGRDARIFTAVGITERRTLVFMREPSDEEKKMNLVKEQRIIKVPNEPDHSVTITPTPTLLFQYSALTYNAHRIHLDRAYCREVEGYRDLLVHGPLSLTLMLFYLRSHLVVTEDQCEYIQSIDYRHLAPLYVDRPMRICIAQQKHAVEDSSNGDEGQPLKRGKEKPLSSSIESIGLGRSRRRLEVERRKWDVWVENQDGGLCVKSTVETIRRRIILIENLRGKSRRKDKDRKRKKVVEAQEENSDGEDSTSRKDGDSGNA